MTWPLYWLKKDTLVSLTCQPFPCVLSSFYSSRNITKLTRVRCFLLSPIHQQGHRDQYINTCIYTRAKLLTYVYDQTNVRCSPVVASSVGQRSDLHWNNTKRARDDSNTDSCMVTDLVSTLRRRLLKMTKCAGRRYRTSFKVQHQRP